MGEKPLKGIRKQIEELECKSEVLRRREAFVKWKACRFAQGVWCCKIGHIIGSGCAIVAHCGPCSKFEAKAEKEAGKNG